MAAAGSVKIKVECLVDGKVSNHQQSFAPSDLVSAVIQAAATAFGLNASAWNLCKDQGRTDVLVPSTTLESNGYKGAHKLWLGKIGGEKLVSLVAADPKALPRLDPIDEQLMKEHDQKVYAFTCAEKSAVTHVDECPVDPWSDKVKGKDQNSIPFHAWLAQLDTMRAESLRRSTLPQLETPKFRECSKERASRGVTLYKDLAIRSHQLKRQEYRHVDGVRFETPRLLDPIIFYTTGPPFCQRMAWLYGTYEKMAYIPAVKASKSEAARPAVGFPLGIRTVVKAVFEPKQRSSKVHIEICQDAEAKALTDQADKIASAAGLKRVGWMFTDLERDAKNTKRFIVKRHAGTYFLKSNELALAAYLQSEFPNRCDYAESGYAGSKFATVVLSGGSERQEDNIEPSVYQVSDIAMELVKQDVFVASTRADLMKVVQDDPDVDLKFEWTNDKADAATKDYFDSSKTNGFIPSETFLVPIPASASLVQGETLFQRNDPQWICTREDFDRNKRRQLAQRVSAVWDEASPREELCDFNLLVYAASLGLDIIEIQALTRELVKPVVDENKVRDLLLQENWTSFVTANLS